ncbi:MAG: 16S rRNA methyltransferase [Spirochaetota bacterium]
MNHGSIVTEVPALVPCTKGASMGADDFERHFSTLFGQRWPALKDALLAPGDAVEYSAGLTSSYHLDSASVSAARLLRLPESGEILDACAAPGGKSLVLASRMSPGSTLLCNELSSDRRRRLSDVLDDHLDEDRRRRVRVSGFDAAAAGGRLSERGRFAAILLDAPCSSERHVLRDQKALERWTPARIRFLAQRQWSLLSSTFLLLAPGGSLVYVTCALSPDENDGPMRRLFKKYGEDAISDVIEEGEAPAFEFTEYGIQYLPDRSYGSGPLYVARVKRSS